ncbi:MAG TPA: hypothetical protein VMK12_28835 [Anaeromyxobacteraceae bacterium]|nr:hypothetical protein [Anaeromyxobacteraceae bacterium]
MTMTEHEPGTRDTQLEAELSGACVACGGDLTARFTPSGVRGVCLKCHLLTTLAVMHTPNGLHVACLSVGAA